MLYPRTSWHQAKVAPGESLNYGPANSKESSGGRYAGASLQLLCGRPRRPSHGDGWLQVILHFENSWFQLAEPVHISTPTCAMSFRQEEGEGEGSVCKMVDIYCSATNRFLHLLIIGRATEPSCQVISASSWTRAPALLTARSALACVQVPRGEIF